MCVSQNPQCRQFLKTASPAILAITLIAFYFLTLSSSIIFGEPPAQTQPSPTPAQTRPAPSAGGSVEAIDDRAFKGLDPATGATISIYPSVLNGERMAGQDYSSLRWSLAPLCLFIVPDADKLEPFQDGNYLIYTVTIVFYHPDMLEQAKSIMNPILKGATGGQFQITNAASYFSLMPHEGLTFRSSEMPDLIIQPIGFEASGVVLQENRQVNFKVPKERKQTFLDYLRRKSLGMEVSFRYVAKQLSRVTCKWTSEDVTETNAFKNLDQGGGQYVTADQVGEIMREAASSRGAYQYMDPGLDPMLQERAEQTFKALLTDFPQILVSDRNQAAEIESRLLAGTGLRAEDFKPITVMWDMLEKLKEIDSLDKANEDVRQFYDNNKQKIDASASAGYGPFSAKFGYEKTSEDMRNQFFKDDQEYKRFRESHHLGKGLEPRITPRGLRLIEKNQFRSAVARTASSVVVQPVIQSIPLTVAATMSSEHELRSARDMFYRTIDDVKVDLVPIGTVLPFAGSTPPLGWRICNGDELPAKAFPVLARALGSMYGSAAGVGKIKLPDLRGRVAVGGGAGPNGLTERKLGEHGGAEQQTMTVSQMPKHTHGVNDPGHEHPNTEDWGFNQVGAASQRYVLHFQPVQAEVANNVSSKYPLTAKAKSNVTVAEAGGGEPFTIMPPYLVVNYIIRVDREDSK